MTHEEHRERHQLLHRELDELFADWITHDTTASIHREVIDFIRWSNEQTKEPTEKTA